MNWRERAPTDIAVARFLANMRIGINPYDVLQVYGFRFSTLTVRIKPGDSVLKFRPYDDAALLEGARMNMLINFNARGDAHAGGVTTTHIPHAGRAGYLMITMPHLGTNLIHVARGRNIVHGESENSEPAFTGFSEREITILLARLAQTHLAFSLTSGLIHSDIFHGTGPQNTVYNPSHHALFLVDAEELTPATTHRTAQFMKQLAQMREWMHMNLLRAEGFSD